ncbi:LCP family protein [Synechococcus sp. HJ21-Hayes]|uniref:LCP family protein n=1 Tax=unclassified Synechococcus TaxID=2626047 RepID=UPI0020CC5976|nr:MULTISPECIES: LCP family protein [unclassified Synechococcus]MCP9832666.1 LCP family protein [Synechococcus sp. JJ3a-Johnson]MCP9852734.1 LCP family protein [Synechococcus sp. HJ21-Hayes]
MSQAQPNRSPSRPRRDRRQGRTAATVTDLETRRQRERAKPRKAQRPPRRSGLGRLPLFLAGIGLGYGLSGPLPQLAKVALGALPHPGGVLTSLVTPAGMGNRRIVVMGTDNVSTNTDVMFTVQLKDGRTELTQIPRDTFIESNKYGVMKANALYSSGDVAMVKQELTRLIAAPVDRYLLVNLQAVQRLANALGGVEVDVPKRMYYVDNSQGLYIDLYPGRQLLKGQELEGFLRFRHDELGDIGRMERQKLVLAEVFRKLANPAMVTRIPELLKIAGSDIRTDLSPVDMGTLLSAMGTTKLTSSRLSGTPYWHDDISYWMPDLNPNHASYKSQEPPI